MRKILLLLLIFPFFFACSSNDDDEKDTDDNKTSFAIRSEDGAIFNVSVFYKEGGEPIKIVDINRIGFGIDNEIFVDYNKVKEIYTQCNMYDKDWLIDTTFTLQEGIKNIFTIKKGTKYIEID